MDKPNKVTCLNCAEPNQDTRTPGISVLCHRCHHPLPRIKVPMFSNGSAQWHTTRAALHSYRHQLTDDLRGFEAYPIIHSDGLVPIAGHVVAEDPPSARTILIDACEESIQACTDALAALEALS